MCTATRPYPPPFSSEPIQPGNDHDLIASGVELAGLVRGAVPYIFFALTDRYEKGLKSSKRRPKFCDVFQDLEEDLNIEVAKFRIVLEQFLHPMLPEEQLQCLLNNPRHSQRTTDLVKAYLRRSYPCKAPADGHHLKTRAPKKLTIWFNTAIQLWLTLKSSKHACDYSKAFSRLSATIIQ